MKIHGGSIEIGFESREFKGGRSDYVFHSDTTIYLVVVDVKGVEVGE